MKNEIEKIENSNYKNILEEVKEAFYDIPFGNSKFQTEAFVISSEITPERAYRAIGLKMLSSIKNLEMMVLNIREAQVDIDEITHKLNMNGVDEFEKRRLEIKREKIITEHGWTNKLINDAIDELDLLYSHFKKFPKFTKEQFEEGERIHFEQRLQRQVVGLEGAKVSLINMNEDFNAFRMFEDGVQKLTHENLNDSTLTALKHSMANFLKFEGLKNDVQSN